MGGFKRTISVLPLLLVFQLILASVAECRMSIGAGQTMPSPVEFANGKNALGIPFRVIDNNMFLNVLVGDSAEAELAFDSGFPMNGVILYDSLLSYRLGLTFVGEVPLGGGGEDIAKAKIAVGGLVSLPGVTFSDQRVLVMTNSSDYGHWPGDGIIGGTVLNSCIAEIDYEKSVINLYEKNSFDTSNAGEVIDLSFSQGIPVVDAVVTQYDGAETPVGLLFDTGADVPFALYSNAGLEFEPPPDAFECYISEGIAGDVYGYWGRVKAIRLGSYVMEDPLVAYPTEGFEIVIATLGQNGFFGLVAQSRFTVTFDYPGSRMYVRPNSRFADPFEFNMAGLVLRTTRDGVKKVYDIIPRSPADAAKLKVGDLILAVDGKDVTSIGFREFEKLLTRENHQVGLTVERAGQRFDVSLKLRRII
ncbi:MAG: PDZ domain-containing protein [Candidatus Zixiibacteriota bacterium]|nr:MAG: PDZ domain-containing protein [candidate division Zixibacteria bacterium]